MEVVLIRQVRDCQSPASSRLPISGKFEIANLQSSHEFYNSQNMNLQANSVVYIGYRIDTCDIGKQNARSKEQNDTTTETNAKQLNLTFTRAQQNYSLPTITHGTRCTTLH
jgi:hypothetical protein